MKAPHASTLLIVINIAVLLNSPLLFAQAVNVDSSTVSAQIEVLDEFQAEQERLKNLIANRPPAYVDKVMYSTDLNEPELTEESLQPEGVRSYFLESRWYTRQLNNTQQTKNTYQDGSLRGEYRQKTLNYGEWIAQGEIREQNNNYNNSAHRSSMQHLTLLNNDLPLTDTTQADSALGSFNMNNTKAFERQARFSLGTNSVRGIGTRIKGQNFELRAGAGKRGKWDSIPYTNFPTNQGALQWLGYSYDFNDKWQTGIQFNHATQVMNSDNEPSTVKSLAATLNYQPQTNEPRSNQARITLIKSQQNQHSAQGFLAEGLLQKGHYSHEWGLFFSEPNLYFGSNLIADNNRGLYWRTGYYSHHLTTGAGFDLEQQKKLDSTLVKSLNFNINFQRKLNLKQTISGNFNYHYNDYTNGIQHNPNNSMSANLSYEYQTANNGLSRVNINLKRQEQIVTNDRAATGEEINWEQEWQNTDTIDKPSFSTALGIAQDRSTTRTIYPTAAINMRHWFNDEWSVNTNLHYSARHGNLSTSQGLSGSLSTERTLANALHIGATLTLNEAKVEEANSLLNTAKIQRNHDKALNIYMRWDGGRGRPFNTLGKKIGNKNGFGTIRGTIFADLNQDGKQQLNEQGMANIELLLDERYNVSTDSNGHYQFYAVTVGEHSLSVNLDSVPLPWGMRDNNHFTVPVPLRNQVYQPIPLINLKGN